MKLTARIFLTGYSWVLLCLWGSAAWAEITVAPRLTVQSGNEQEINSIAISPDGKLLVSKSVGSLKLWDVFSGRVLRDIKHQEGFSGNHMQSFTTFSPDGNRVLSGSDSGDIKLWDVTSGQEVNTALGYRADRLIEWDKKQLGGQGLTVLSLNTKIVASTSNASIELEDLVSGQDIKTLDSGEIWWITFSPDSKMLAAVGKYSISLWDVEKGRKLYTFDRFSRDVKSVAFSPDGKIFGSWNKHTIKLWNLVSGQEIHTLDVDAGEIKSVVFSPDSRMLASGSQGIIKLWSVSSGQELHTLIGHSGEITSITFSPDGKTLASGSLANYSTSISLQSYTKIIELLELQGAGFEQKNLDEIQLIVGKERAKGIGSPQENRVTVFDQLLRLAMLQKAYFEQKNKVIIPRLESENTGNIFTEDKKSDFLKLWDVASGQELSLPDSDTRKFFSSTVNVEPRITNSTPINSGPAISNLTLGVNSVVFSLDGKTLVATLEGSHFPYILDLSNNGREIPTQSDDIDIASIDSVSFSPDGETLAFVDGEIHLLDMGNGRGMRHFNEGGVQAFSSAFSPDGKLLVSAGEFHFAGGVIKLWDVVKGRKLHSFDGIAGRVSSVSFSPDGKVITALVSGELGTSNSLRWDVSNWRKHPMPDIRNSELEKNIGMPSQFTVTTNGYPSVGNTASKLFSPDGRVAVSNDNYGTINLWDSVRGKKIRTLGHSCYWMNSDTFSFSPDGRIVKSQDIFGTLKLWDVSSGRELQTFDWENYETLKTFSYDGKMLASEGEGGINLWDVKSGKKTHTLDAHSSFVSSATFSKDGKMLATLDGHSVKFWRVLDGALLATLITFWDDSWVVFDPEGRYDASDPSNSPNLHWVVGLTPISLEQLKDRYYEPGLISKVTGHNHEALRPVPNLVDALVKPYPEVRAQVSPDQPNRIDITLTNQGGGIGPVRVRVNGKEVEEDARQGKNLSGKMSKLSVDIDPNYLLPGENQVEVIAWNADKLLRSWPARLTLDGAKARGRHGADGKPVVSLSPLPPPTLHAIVVGVSNYANPDMKLAFSGKDAADFAQALEVGAQRLFGADKVKLHLFTDYEGKGQLPARAVLEEAFQQVAKEASASDILVVYLAGHGVMSAGDDGDYYYLTREAQGLNLADPSVRKLWGISASELTSWVKAIKAAKQVMILDTCAAGGAAEKLTVNRAVTRGQILALDRLQERTGFHVLAGAAADKVSLESSRYSQGLLTYALLTGMKGAALREGEFVDVATLFNYAADQVPQLAIGVGGIQRPQVLSARGSTFDIGELKNEDKIRVPLAQALPMMLRASFQDEDKLNDHLKLSQRFNHRLAADNYAASRGAMVFVDAEEFPEAWRISGRYEKNGAGWKLKAKLFQGDEAREPPLFLDLSADPDKQVEVLYQAVIQRIADSKK